MTKCHLTLALAALVGSILPLGQQAQAQSTETRLTAKMLSGTASAKADYRERDKHRYLRVKAESLSGTAGSTKALFVKGVWVGNITLTACPVPAQQLLCGEMELDTQNGQAVLPVSGGQIIQIGLTPTLLAGTFR